MVKNRDYVRMVLSGSKKAAHVLVWPLKRAYKAIPGVSDGPQKRVYGAK